MDVPMLLVSKKFNRFLEESPEMREQCKCGHSRQYHAGAKGDCLICDKNGKFCPCDEFRPVRKEGK